MNVVEQLREIGFRRINFKDGPAELGSPLCKNLDEMRQLGLQLIEILTQELVSRGFDTRGQAICRQIFETGWKAELTHAAADSQLSTRGGKILINPGYHTLQGDIFPFSYWPEGGRSPAERAIIVAAPGLKAMSPDDLSVFRAALKEMGLSFRENLLQIREIFQEARRRVKEAEIHTGYDLLRAHQGNNTKISYKDLTVYT